MGNENTSDGHAPGRGVEEAKGFDSEEAPEICTPTVDDAQKELPAMPSDVVAISDQEEEDESIPEHEIDQWCFENVKISDNRSNAILTPGDFLIGRLEAIMQTASKTNNNKKKRNAVVIM